MKREAFRVPIDKITKICDSSQFSFQSTAELAQDPEIIGQDRAARALAFGIDISSSGFNVFALGPSGVGKTTTVKQFLKDRAEQEAVSDDWCYVNNFVEPRKPRALRLPAGRGCQLRSDMESFIKQIETEIPRAFESDYYLQRQNELTRGLQERQGEELSNLERYVQERGFALLKTPMGLVIAPVLDGKVLNPEQYEQLPQEIKQRFESHRQELQEALEKATRRARETEKSSQESLKNLNSEVATFALGHLVDELKAKYAELPTVIEYIENVQKDIVDNVERFLPQEQSAPPPGLPFMDTSDDGIWFNRYKVNVIVDNCEAQGAPVVVETHPTYYNLAGSIEHRALFGAWLTDFTMIKGGALHRANGGYLVLDARSLLVAPFAWDALKRALRTQLLKIEEMGQEYRSITTSTLEPDPIPLDVKVIIIGGPEIYYPLMAYDDEFGKLFKVKADFDVQIPWTEDNALKYASFIACRAIEEGLLHYDRGGVARVVEYSARSTGDQKKLSTRFSDIADLVREASYWAQKEGHELVTAEDVERTIKERIYRNNRIQERMQEMITDDMIMIDTTGEVVGQVNGLAVISLGDYAFGRPSRITAKTFLGRSGVINIDREVKLTESTHDKGLLILTGYLESTYAQDQPLTLSATLTFEQGYDGVAGDSASSTELYALLSSIAQLPLQQGIAVTGSVNQHGHVQPIGGATQKIEGFYDICKARGLTGEQGVIIPAANVRSLMLRQDVLEAVRDGRFHIYAVETIDQGMGILTGLDTGERQEDGTYPEGTVNYHVARRLQEMSDKMQKYGRGPEDKEDEKKETEEEEGEPEPEEGPVPTPPEPPAPPLGDEGDGAEGGEAPSAP